MINPDTQTVLQYPPKFYDLNLTWGLQKLS